MISKVAQKRNISSIQVIKTLKLLLQGDFSMNELIQKLNDNELSPIFNNSVISKYINTCRYCGIEIKKLHNKYYVASMPFGLELSLDDSKILQQMQTAINNGTNQSAILFNNLIKKINRYSNTKIATVDKDEFNFSCEVFEQAIAQKRKIKLFFKDRSILECIPLNIVQTGEKTFFVIYNKRIRQIDINRLSGIQFSENSYIEPFDGKQVVVFKLKGNLAKRYEARENETVQQNPDGTITVTNRNENEEYLISRLLRYDNKCEVLRPKMFRDNMKEILNNMLGNYGES